MSGKVQPMDPSEQAQAMRRDLDAFIGGVLPELQQAEAQLRIERGPPAPTEDAAAAVEKIPPERRESMKRAAASAMRALSQIAPGRFGAFAQILARFTMIEKPLERLDQPPAAHPAKSSQEHRDIGELVMFVIMLSNEVNRCQSTLSQLVQQVGGALFGEAFAEMLAQHEKTKNGKTLAQRFTEEIERLKSSEARQLTQVLGGGSR